MNDKIRKYVLPNIPYFFIGWFCLKLGAAYRLAAGANIGLKLVGMMGMIGPAFQSFAPGLVLFDWIVGIAGAALLRYIIYRKVKNAKKFLCGIWFGPLGLRKGHQAFCRPQVSKQCDTHRHRISLNEHTPHQSRQRPESQLLRDRLQRKR